MSNEEKIAMIKRNEKILKKILKQVVKIAKKSEMVSDYDKLKDTTIQIAQDKILARLDTIDYETVLDVKIQLMALYEACASDKGILSFMRRSVYQVLVFDEIVKLIGMSKDK